MRTTNSRLNRQQQVKVVIRLKPQLSEYKNSKCVSLSEQENHLVVETDYKKQIFVFDHVAHPLSSQSDIYNMMGAEAVSASLEGFNCCIFAYGQTGAGKTFSIMGDINELQKDTYSPSRGILPRLLEDLFNSTSQSQTTYQVTCSYIEIYNEQIYDLLSQDKRVHQIRQDHRKGVFVEGAVETKIQSYRQAVDLLLEGDKTRRIAMTNMNQQSSRSHVIFTIFIQSFSKEDDIVKVKKAKLNIVDLAGSERVKYTMVEGERLRQASNINRSLHVLGNVINSLVQSTKKKKHIPYRDSKLTYYLKDSLGGNSITKLLANVHCNKEYYGDTLSTLMFAKRAKILKMRVEVNQNLTQNFQTLRKEVKKLREELAQAKYFRESAKTERYSSCQDLQQTLQKIADNSDFQVAPKLQAIQVFEQNQLHFKTLIQIYEEHMKECQKDSQILRRTNIQKYGQWKNVERKNLALTNLLRQFPAFTKIYKQNLLLKQQRKNVEELPILNQYQKIIPTKRTAQQTTFIVAKQSQRSANIDQSAIQEVIQHYESLIDDMKQTFSTHLESLQKSYGTLEHELKIKDTKIKQLIKRQNVPPDIEELRNQNQYLQLNILNLQNQIQQLQQKINKNSLQIKQYKKNSHRRSSLEKQGLDEESQDFIGHVLQKLNQVKKEAQKQAQLAELQRQNFENVVKQLNNHISSLLNQNNKLQLRCNRSGSQKKSREKYNMTASSFFEPMPPHPLKSSLIELSTPPKPPQHFLQTTTTNHESTFQPVNTKQLITLRVELKSKHKEIVDLQEQLQQYEKGDTKIEEEFGKSLNTIIKQYRNLVRRSMPPSPNSYSKTMKSIGKYKEQDPVSAVNSFLDSKVNEKLGHKKRPSFDFNTSKQKDTPNKVKREENTTQSNFYSSQYNSKRNFFSSK